MPKQLEADDNVPTPPRLRTPDSAKRRRAPDFDPWIRIKVMADGACLYRALHMGMQLRGGIAAEALQDRPRVSGSEVNYQTLKMALGQDDNAGAQSLRSQVCCCMQKYLDSLTPERLRQVTETVCVEPLRDLEPASSDALPENGLGFGFSGYVVFGGPAK